MQHILQRLRDTDRPIKWLFYGDSITHGALHTFGWRDYTELFTERLRFEMPRARDVVIKTALSGNTTDDLLRDYDWRVGQFKPDVTLVMIGMNDCSTERNLSLERFETNLQSLSDRLRRDGSLVIWQTTNPIQPGCAPQREANFEAYMDAIRRHAAAEALPLIDHARHWQDRRDKLCFWLSDPIHPNEMGHRVFAHELFRALDLFDDQSPTCRLFIA